MVEMVEIKPVVGMGCTVCYISDRRAATIVEVSKSLETIKIQIDESKRIDGNGMSEQQEYEYTRNPEAYIWTYTKRKNDRYYRQGESMRGAECCIGIRKEYYDFSF